ncbi:TRAP transporter small permease subunit [Aestuariispira insulae]|uniref:TRAP transporter small permease protein n=1 Tax=Aestuariispira insulae TaxID=1461337 RepID=A0A3D9HJY1_9PROT|nr:TRAP transporter small permease [Aestuariispira insulae]RED49778.1 TRAP-type mannitol/chloroaromatic compound transport system permease small subunit [Aestuariispira insulae]
MMKNIFLTFEKWTERLAEHAALAGGLLMLVCCFMVSAEILLRKLFNHSIGGADELTGYALGIATSWSFAYALACRANIRIDSLYMMLPLRFRGMVDLLALLAMGAVLVFATIFAIKVMNTTASFGSRANTPLQTPLIIPQALWVVGYVLSCLLLLSRIGRAATLLITGQTTQLHSLLAARTVEDEIRDETAGRPAAGQ